MIPYDVLSGWYDELMADVPYEEWSERILTILDHWENPPKTILEMACGTGRITSCLLDAGYWVTGVDRSEAMLQGARETLGNGNGRLRLIASDMLDFNTTEQFDAIIAVCDGFNYLASLESLEKMLEKCKRLCRKGGLILFDLSTDWKFKNQLQDTVIAENHEDMAFIWENRYDETQRLLEFDLTFFIKEGELFRREAEHHTQRAHSTQEIEHLCRKTGLGVHGFYDGYTALPARKDSERIHCILINGGNS